MDMVYGVDSTDTEGYLKLFQDYIILWNELLPEIPLVLQHLRFPVPRLAGRLRSGFLLGFLQRHPVC